MALRDPEIRDGVMWIFIGDTQTEMEENGFYAANAAAEQLDQARWDHSIRAVVLTGQNDGQYYRLNRRTHWDVPKYRGRLNPAKNQVVGGARVPAAQETILQMDKPVIARVNGDAIGFGASTIWAADFVVAREDALIAWGFQGLGEIVDSNGEKRGMPWPLTPTYGTYSFPLMPPAMLKEFVMLSKVYSASELAEARYINAAVPMPEIDAVIETMLKHLLAMPPYVVGRTKRVINKYLLDQYNKTEDLASAYSQLDMWQQGASGAMD